MTGFHSVHAIETQLILKSSVKPYILKIDAGTCTKPGNSFRVQGKSIGSSRLNGLALSTQRGMLVLKITNWSEKTGYISVLLPESKWLSPGSREAVVIYDRKTRQIVSNRDKYLQLCQTATLKPNLLKSLQQSEASGLDEEVDENYYEESNSHRPASGSLIGNLPRPSFVPVVKQKDDKTIEKGELIIVSESMQKAKEIEAKVSDFGYRIKRRRMLKSMGFVINVIALPDGVKVAEALKQLQSIDRKLLVDANHRYTLQSGSVNKNSQSLQTMIGWGKVTGSCGKKIKIGVLDSLAEVNGSLFKNGQVINKSLLPFGVRPAKKEHATAIASILVSQHGSDVGGLLPAAKVYVAGIFREKNKQVDTTAELIIRGLDWLQGQRVHAINLSIAGPRNLLLEISIKRLLAQNTLVAAAVGNNAKEDIAMYPAAIKGVMGVTAVDGKNRIYSRANRGAFVNIAAPGVDVWAARGTRDEAFVSGTSYATPYVAAALAVLRQRHPEMKYSQLIKQLQSGAKDLGNPGTDKIYGTGLLQFKGCR